MLKPTLPKLACSQGNGRYDSRLSTRSQSELRSHSFKMHVEPLLGTGSRRRELALHAQPPSERDTYGTKQPGAPVKDDLEHLSPGSAAAQIENERRPKSIWGRIKYFFIGEKLDRKRLAALGLGAVASYGFVSNATYGTGMAVSWIAFVKRTGRSPLMAGQWKPFLTFFAGFWTIQNFLRPLRLTLAIAMAPAFDKILLFLQNRTGWNKRNAFGLYLFGFGSLTCVFVFGSIYLFAGPLAFARTV